jgi:hypothetical protein
MSGNTGAQLHGKRRHRGRVEDLAGHEERGGQDFRDGATWTEHGFVWMWTLIGYSSRIEIIVAEGHTTFALTTQIGSVFRISSRSEPDDLLRFWSDDRNTLETAYF